jgi:SAM-dependent methyltransferase
MPLVRPLEDDWRETIDAIARARRWPTSETPAQLGALVRALSDAYNATPGNVAVAAGLSRAIASSGPALAARLGFSFARDVPKCAGAARELIASRALAGLIGEGRAPLRVLDVGAGMGATTWGFARAIAATGARMGIDATWMDEDGLALEVGMDVVRARGGRVDDREQVKLTVRTERRRAAPLVPGATWDVILAGQVLSELDANLAPEERVARHVVLLTSYVRALSPGGALVVVEPALGERTRHLHAVRDAILAARAASVFAPCLHATACPALQHEGEWCHEDLPVDLPEWLVPVARAAGLRWQGLTFSYLVLRAPDAPTLAGLLPRAAVRLRVVSDPIVTKGKREHFMCGVLRPGDAHDDALAPETPPLAERARVMRLDRELAEANAAWSDLRRGDVVSLEPAPDPEKPRVGKTTLVKVLGPAS